MLSRGDGVGDGDGLADAGGLDDDVVEAAALGDVVELAREVVGERAADAAVGERDQAVGLGQAAVCDQVGVDVDLADVVDDHGGADALVVGEDVVEKGGLAGTEVAGEHDDLDLLVAGLAGGGHGCSLVGWGAGGGCRPSAQYTEAP